MVSGLESSRTNRPEGRGGGGPAIVDPGVALGASIVVQPIEGGTPLGADVGRFVPRRYEASCGCLVRASRAPQGQPMSTSVRPLTVPTKDLSHR